MHDKELKEIGKIISNWAKEYYFIKRIWLFGSRTKNKEKPDSDLDIAFEIDKQGADLNIRTTWTSNGNKFEYELTSLIGIEVRAILYSHELESKSAQWIDKDGIFIYPDIE